MSEINDIIKHCYKCKTAPCMKTCPIHNNIPLIIKLYEEEKYKEAYDVLINNNPLFMLCGKTCDHMRFCGKSCTSQISKNIRIKFELIEEDLFKRFAFNYQFDKITKGKVLIVGAGPSGLMASILLRKAGYDVCLIDKVDHIGGVIYSLIPSFRFDHKVLIDLENYLMPYINIKLKTIFDDDFDITPYEKIIFCMGTEKAISQLKNENVIDGLTLLYNLKIKNEKITNKKIAVLGLGNVAVDCARSLKKLGNDVEIIYRRNVKNSKASLEELETLKNENIMVRELLACVDYHNSTAKFKRMKLGEVDESNRQSFIPTNEFIDLEFDLLVEAYGSKPQIDYLSFDLALNDFLNHGYIEVKNYKNYFFLGDFYTGATSIVETLSKTKVDVLKIISNDLVIENIKEKHSSKDIYFGGSFNPITKAHMQIYEYLRYNISPNVYLLPNSTIYPTKDLLSINERISLIKKAIPDALIDDTYCKMEFNGSVDFLRKKNHPLFVIGSDSLSTLDTWIDAANLVKENYFICFKRAEDDLNRIIKEHQLLNDYIDHFYFLDLDILAISSTTYRNSLDERIVSKSVHEEVLKKSFYR